MGGAGEWAQARFASAGAATPLPVGAQTQPHLKCSSAIHSQGLSAECNLVPNTELLHVSVALSKSVQLSKIIHRCLGHAVSPISPPSQSCLPAWSSFIFTSPKGNADPIKGVIQVQIPLRQPRPSSANQACHPRSVSQAGLVCNIRVHEAREPPVARGGAPRVLGA